MYRMQLLVLVLVSQSSAILHLHVLANLFLRKYRTDLLVQYGIYERGRCPSGLKEGFLRWDDDDVKLSHVNVNDKGGSFPD